MPVRRQLQQDRRDTVAEPPRHGQELLQRLGAVVQLLHMRDVAAGLEREFEALRRLRQPVIDIFDRRESVEAVVDLDAVELARIIR